MAPATTIGTIGTRLGITTESHGALRTAVPAARGTRARRSFRWYNREMLRSTLLLLLLAAPAAQSQARSAKPAAPPLASTMVGVYTNEQASRGKDVYAGSCRSCHSPASHTGATFNEWWRGKRLSDLYGYVATNMPKNDPGSLSAEDAADVVAFLLKMNKMPVGRGELPPDLDSLKHFRIETKRVTAMTRATTTGTAGTTATRKKP